MVQKKVKAIEWTENAVGNFNEILEHLAKRSPSAVDIVGNALLDIIESLDTECDIFIRTGLRKIMIRHIEQLRSLHIEFHIWLQVKPFSF
jgi:plasmid stabilization system protein ParE